MNVTGSFGWNVSAGEFSWSEKTFSIFGYDQSTKPTLELLLNRVHPDDLAFVQLAFDRAPSDGGDLDLEYRLQMPVGSVKYVHLVACAARSESGNLEFKGAVSDRTAAKIKEDEIWFRRIVDAVPHRIGVLDADGKILYENRLMREYTGIASGLDSGRTDDEVLAHVNHPEDLERMKNAIQDALESGAQLQLETRVRSKEGLFRWFLVFFSPVRDENGRIVRWFTSGIDIDDRKQAEERAKNENLALREEINRTSMFEQIVGSSDALRALLVKVAKVAPTNSTVLLTGETGTGKELVARTIHKRSRRSSRPFVSVNCAAIPTSLIASELFGHEKGSFTGALQRRLGLFEFAEGGTIFLDEVGEFPQETQIALLRVLQEREFQRVGGNQLLRADVRVIAATNRDLEASIAAGSFRQDLYYRLSVFPIEIPALRDRKEDIPLLVEYFIDRYARKVGKPFRTIEKTTLELLESYSWPGNIRELQNVIERSIIVCDTDRFTVDPSWLSVKTSKAFSKCHVLSKRLATKENETIEAALAQTNGRVAGPSGAAAVLGMPASTLEFKIRSLKIDKFGFKSR